MLSAVGSARFPDGGATIVVDGDGALAHTLGGGLRPTRSAAAAADRRLGRVLISAANISCMAVVEFDRPTERAPF